jgi:hypothetical protein
VLQNLIPSLRFRTLRLLDAKNKWCRKSFFCITLPSYLRQRTTMERGIVRVDRTTIQSDLSPFPLVCRYSKNSVFCELAKRNLLLLRWTTASPSGSVKPLKYSHRNVFLNTNADFSLPILPLGENIHPRGQSSPMGANWCWKNWPLTTTKSYQTLFSQFYTFL